MIVNEIKGESNNDTILKRVISTNESATHLLNSNSDLNGCVFSQFKADFKKA